ncbi:diguanylate cyclase [Rhizobium rhizosphaerae]|uniref:Diguanylate cyclase n=1 Tax=Xaviernesmea rhizosphaerae TaxID=1672749 RepID=A0A1Q9AL82_9HYPH|nr:DinB family protein [Xaviernesmea rhizosphaerae]OLP55994.1 diguanylate cyclase [Xaviernesmea rhizosphaerae]
MKQQFRLLAAYNAWANERLYEAAQALDDDAYHTDKGAFFGALHGTLSHLLITDRVWLYRLTGQGAAPTSLRALPYDALAPLAAARKIEDRRLIDYVEALEDADFGREITYQPLSMPQPITQRIWPLLIHLFNHQTHHRGQAHATLTALGRPSLVLDIAYFLSLPEQASLVGEG